MKQTPYDFRPMNPDELKEFIADRVARDYAAHYNGALDIAERFKAKLMTGDFKVIRDGITPAIEIVIWKFRPRPPAQILRTALGHTFNPIGYTSGLIIYGVLTVTIRLYVFDPAPAAPSEIKASELYL